MFRQIAKPRKAELTSMIDMIFLLLIFFLVTLAVNQSDHAETPTTTPDNLPFCAKSSKPGTYDLKILVERSGPQFTGYLLDPKETKAQVNAKIARSRAQVKDQITKHQAQGITTSNNPVQDSINLKEAESKRFYFPVVSQSPSDSDIKTIQETIRTIDARFKLMKSLLASSTDRIPRIVMEMDQNVAYQFLTSVDSLFYLNFLSNRIYNPDDAKIQLTVYTQP